ncbi:hypothetical protein Tco_0573964 [Tanacetum coccineum]
MDSTSSSAERKSHDFSAGLASEVRLKREAFVKAYEVKHKKELTLMQCKELEFLTLKPTFRIVLISYLITEYLVNINKRRAFWSLNEDILKITILTTNTPYPSRKIRRIRACTHQRPQRKPVQYAVSSEDQYAILEIMDDPNITMEEYIRLEEEKARKCGKVFNWETAKYGRIWYDEDNHDLRSFEN